MKREEFREAALSILSSRVEMPAWELKRAIWERHNNGAERPKSFDESFLVRMAALVRNGDVVRQMRDTPVEEQCQTFGAGRAPYFRLTSSVKLQA